MTILDEVLSEEYDRLERGILLLREEISILPEGYISQKKIGNNTYYYLQRRKQKQVLSKHIKKEDLETIRGMIQRRKELTQRVKELKTEQQKIKRVLKQVKVDE